MIEPIVVGLRLVQYLGAMLLMGASLFFLYCGGPMASAGGMMARTRHLILVVFLAVTRTD